MYQLEEAEIEKEFQEDIDDICNKLITTYSLKFTQNVENLSSPVLRWLDFRLRYVDPQPRNLAFSDRFPKTKLPKDAKKGLKKLQKLIQTGKDINPYQGRGLKLRNDSSGHNADSRTDLLWADWNILHFHLSAEPIPSGQYFSKPADYLLFCIVEDEVVAFIDILRHPKKEGFADLELIKTLHRSWPEYIQRFPLERNSEQEETELSTNEIHNLRANGCNYLLNLNGESFINPGMGITSALTPLKISGIRMHISRYIQALASMVCDPNSQFQKEINSLSISTPKFSLIATPDGWTVYEEKSQIAFVLQPEEQQEMIILDMITPRWTMKHLQTYTPNV
jgi:hypothetical protein